MLPRENLIRWAYGLGIDTSIYGECLFRTYSIHGDLKIIKLLLELRPETDITSNDHEVF